ncbi:hypothetical protein PIB30_014846 [Stylosanthes scabra]|uniref:Uncharacterized protein n=1 Tax=Stylosanthes scabra TaxID=79078 RepID=A0ABU6S739_9FABA|nr:hypothetical protein [Stylosanthes scabra]
MPHVLYEALELGPLKKIIDVFTTADCSIVSAAGIIEDVMVKVKRLVIPTAFHIIKPPPGKRGHPQKDYRNISDFTPSEKKNRQDDRRMRGKEEVHIEMIEALIRELLQKLREAEGLEKEEKGKETTGRYQVEQKKEKDKSQGDCLSTKEMFNEMEQILYHNKGANIHLIRNNSKWK